MRDHFVAAVAALAIFTASSPAAATTFPAYGGPGDTQFDDHCPPHQFLIGLAGHVGLWINQIQMVCSPILPDGTHGAKSYGPLHGGGGGTPIELTCPADSVVYGTRVYITGYRHTKINRVDLSCGSMQADRQSAVQFYSGDQFFKSYGNQAAQCSGGELGFGLSGHFGADVNAIGLDCAIIQR